MASCRAGYLNPAGHWAGRALVPSHASVSPSWPSWPSSLTVLAISEPKPAAHTGPYRAIQGLYRHHNLPLPSPESGCQCLAMPSLDPAPPPSRSTVHCPLSTVHCRAVEASRSLCEHVRELSILRLHIRACPLSSRTLEFASAAPSPSTTLSASSSAPDSAMSSSTSNPSSPFWDLLSLIRPHPRIHKRINSQFVLSYSLPPPPVSTV